MKQTISLYDFRRAFEQTRPNNFSYEGLEVLFNYLEQYEEDTGEEMEFDVIGLCCDYSEDTWQNIAENYRIDLSDCEGEDDYDKIEKVREYLQSETTLVGETEDGFVYAVF